MLLGQNHVAPAGDGRTAAEQVGLPKAWISRKLQEMPWAVPELSQEPGTRGTCTFQGARISPIKLTRAQRGQEVCQGHTAAVQQDLLRSAPDWKPHVVLSKLKNHLGPQFSHLSSENLGILVYLPELFLEAKGNDRTPVIMRAPRESQA